MSAVLLLLGMLGWEAQKSCITLLAQMKRIYQNLGEFW